MGEADSALSARIAFAPWPLMVSSDTKLCISLSCASVERKGMSYGAGERLLVPSSFCRGEGPAGAGELPAENAGGRGAAPKLPTSALGHGLMARSEPMLSTCHGVSLLSGRSSSKSEGVMLSAVRLRDRVLLSVLALSAEPAPMLLSMPGLSAEPRIAGDSSKLGPLGRIFEKAGEHPDE